MTPTSLTGAETIRWDLSDLYAAPDDPRLAQDQALAEKLADDFAAAYRGQVASLTPESLASALSQLESIATLLSKLGGYAYLGWSTDTASPVWGKLLAASQEFGAKIQQKILFFELEWANAPAEILGHLQHPAVAPYKHYLEVERLNQPYMLSEAEEKVIARLNLTGVESWTRYFGEVMSRTRYPYEGRDLSQAEILTLIKAPEREVRRQAADIVTDVLRAHQHTTTYIFNMILLDKANKDEMRGYKSWLSARNLSNQVSDEIVDALISAVTGRYDIVGRYYRLLGRQLGLETLYDYDRYAPLAKVKTEIHWDKARDIVLNAFAGFDQRLADVASLFFEKNWIDAALAPHKRMGAYSASLSAKVHPYIFMNYDGEARDVATLAHELGHGIHQYLAREQGEFQQNTPLTTAEMASTFGEMLVFDYLMKAEPDPAVRLSMRMEKIADTFATVFRQVSMNRFEDTIHNLRRSSGELTTDQLSEAWYATQAPMFGDSLTLREEYRIWWSYIPHFLNTPGYVYAYAFGELLVWALYARYQAQTSGFADRYLEVLKAGGSDYPHNILAPMGVDLRDPAFWHEGLNLLDAFVAQTEADAQALG